MTPRPQPRYRLYTSAGAYGALLGGLLRPDSRALEALEAALCARTGSPHAVCAPRARVAIYLALRALVAPGKSVVMSPYTIADVVNMVIAAGLRPVFADLEPDTCNVDPAELERLVDADTGAVLVTHLHGLACDMERIGAFCRERGVPLIEDAAQAFGARFQGKPVGTFGDAGIHSFGLYKNVNSFFGGLLLTPHARVAEAAREQQLAWARERRGTILKKALSGLMTDIATTPALFKRLVYPVFRFGFLHDVRAINRFVEIELDLERHDRFPEVYERQLTPAQASATLRQLDGVDSDTACRISYAKVYAEGLAGAPGLVLPPFHDDGSHIYTYYPVRARDRRGLLQWLMRHGRDVAAQHLKNCADLPAFREFARDCPVARATAQEIVLLPTYPRYGIDQVRENVRVVRDYCDRLPTRRPRPLPVAASA